MYYCIEESDKYFSAYIADMGAFAIVELVIIGLVFFFSSTLTSRISKRLAKDEDIESTFLLEVNKNTNKIESYEDVNAIILLEEEYKKILKSPWLYTISSLLHRHCHPLTDCSAVTHYRLVLFPPLLHIHPLQKRDLHQSQLPCLQPEESLGQGLIDLSALLTEASLQLFNVVLHLSEKEEGRFVGVCFPFVFGSEKLPYPLLVLARWVVRVRLYFDWQDQVLKLLPYGFCLFSYFLAPLAAVGVVAGLNISV